MSLELARKREKTLPPHRQVSPSLQSDGTLDQPTIGYLGSKISPGTAMQLQRLYGNQKTLQLLREPVTSVRYVQTTDTKLIQPDRLVEIQSAEGTDEKDFNSTRKRVEAGLGIKSSGNWLEGNNFAGLKEDEILYIWGHMTPNDIGTVEFSELAEIMVEQGFTTCAAIILIGCNDQENYGQAPKALWEGLKKELEENGKTDALDKIPTIYATKGPLHSGVGKKIYDFKDWWVATSTEKEDDLKKDLEKIRLHLNGEKVEDIGYLMTWFEQQAEGLNLKPTKENWQKIASHIRKQKQESLKKKGSAEYPSLLRPTTDDNGMEWNPDALVSYP